MQSRITGILFCLAIPVLLCAQTPDNSLVLPVTVAAIQADPLSRERILGIIPDFQTVRDPQTPYVPLRVRDKWRLFFKETVDPYTFVSAAAGAALSQSHDAAPQYGVGAEPYLQRFGAAMADVTTQNFFSDAVLASLLHEDPRYFRMGPGRTVIRRIGYALSRVAIARKDSGKEGFSFSEIGGMGLGIALSDAYYPPRNVNGGEMESRVVTSLTASALGNLLPEFWPDVKAKLDRLRHK
jgi:hypothetical protein